MEFMTDSTEDLKQVRAECSWLDYDSDTLVDRRGAVIGFYDYRTVEGDIYRVARWHGSLPAALQGRIVTESVIYKALAYPSRKDTWIEETS